jgi:hypothetical protein
MSFLTQLIHSFCLVYRINAFKIRHMQLYRYHVKFVVFDGHLFISFSITQHIKGCTILKLASSEVVRIICTLNCGRFLCSLKNTSSCVRVPLISARNNRVRGRSHSPFLSWTKQQNRAHLLHWTHNPICHGPQSVLPLMVCCIHGVMLIDSPLEAPHKEIPLQNSCVISNHPHLI